MLIGYHASHEQFPPSRLLTLAKAAEDAGFGGIMTSDHITPWSERQANSGNNWAWLGAALAATSLPFSSLAIPGGWRYHPVVLAHTIATLAEIYPDRLRWIAVGSGEALNEAVVGNGWPDKTQRNERLLAGTEIIRALLRGDTVSVRHPWFAAEDAKLWSRPARSPLFFGAALTSATAAWMGPWADGLITGKPRVLQLQVAWATNKEEARIAAWQNWRNAAAPPDCLAELKLPRDFDAVTRGMAPEEIEDVIPLIVHGEELLALIGAAGSCGFEEIYIHNVSLDQEGFLWFMAREVIPYLTSDAQNK
ncbi:LLM class flavin-dependent oxidoreductase [Rhizobium sp. XQZ8]|uniref:LLM class flavin-dependent oxidoreductase n=1 Tax=Rhizobium populisoli TaxID=2859785 RepID=UPI001CA46F6D|nr:LLM class flavin-dependent oxidoreductase [Rhizobium populisoli]MBW6425203.1 LLM class flavin-dependent oxidoreductase [Rhizobium populisoli]